MKWSKNYQDLIITYLERENLETLKNFVEIINNAERTMILITGNYRVVHELIKSVKNQLNKPYEIFFYDSRKCNAMRRKSKDLFLQGKIGIWVAAVEERFLRNSVPRKGISFKIHSLTKEKYKYIGNLILHKENIQTLKLPFLYPSKSFLLSNSLSTREQVHDPWILTDYLQMIIETKVMSVILLSTNMGYIFDFMSCTDPNVAMTLYANTKQPSCGYDLFWNWCFVRLWKETEFSKTEINRLFDLLCWISTTGSRSSLVEHIRARGLAQFLNNPLPINKFFHFKHPYNHRIQIRNKIILFLNRTRCSFSKATEWLMNVNEADLEILINDSMNNEEDEEGNS